MPTLAALDECLTAITGISELAQQGVTDPAKRETALREIVKCCEQAREAVARIAESVPYDDLEDEPSLQ